MRLVWRGVASNICQAIPRLARRQLPCADRSVGILGHVHGVRVQRPVDQGLTLVHIGAQLEQPQDTFMS